MRRLISQKATGDFKGPASARRVEGGGLTISEEPSLRFWQAKWVATKLLEQAVSSVKLQPLKS